MSVRHPVAAALIALLAPSAAAGDLPRVAGYQGRLLRSDGTAATGTAGVGFAVFDAPTGGTPLWSEVQTLGLSDGYYATFLGLVDALPSMLFDDGPRWLQISVGGETLAPRQQIGAVPFATTAQSVRGGTAAVVSLKVGGQTVIDADGRLAGAARYTAGPGLALDGPTQTFSLQACAVGRTLVRDGSGWQCMPAATVTGVAASTPLHVADPSTTPLLTIAQSAADSDGYLSSTDWSDFRAKYGAQTQCGGDLSGILAAPVVARLQSRPVAATAPADGQVLKWNAAGSRWEPSGDANSGGTVRDVVAAAPLTAEAPDAWTFQLSIAPAGPGADGYLSSADWDRFDAKFDAASQCGGDLDGAWGSPLVARIQGLPVATTVPGAAQVLRFDGSAWAPASLQISDVGSLASGYLDLTGAQTVGGAKTFTNAPAFGSALAPSGGGTGSSTAFTQGSVVFAGAAGAYSQDNANFFWDGTGRRLGVGTAAPEARLDVAGLVRAQSDSGDILQAYRPASGVNVFSVSNIGRLDAGATTLGAKLGDTQPAHLNVGGGALVVANPGGNVGVGTASPGYLLDVFGANVQARIGQTSGDGAANLRLENASGSAYVAKNPASGGNVLNGSLGNALVLAVDGAHAIQLGTNHAPRVTIDGSGNVGVGTTSPGATLEVNGTLAAGSVSGGGMFTSARGTATSTYGFRHEGAGYWMQMGVPNTAYAYLETNVPNGFMLDGTVRVNGGASVGSYGSAPPSNGLVVSGSVGIGTSSPGDRLHVSQGSIGLDPGQMLRIGGAGDGNWGVLYNGGGGCPTGACFDLRAGVGNGTFRFIDDPAGAVNVRMAIRADDGRVGIGTAAPVSRLAVAADASVTGTVTTSAGLGSNAIMLQGPGGAVNSKAGFFAEWNGPTSGLASGFVLGRTGGGWGTYVGVHTHGEGGNIDDFVERLRVDPSGKVGIGTTDPQATLDVNGTLRLAKNASAPVGCDTAHAGTLALTALYATCVCNGTSWVSAANGTSACDWGVVAATGGTVTYDGSYRIHTFTGAGSYTFTVTSATAGGTVELLVVAGGGGGCGGGGGAGGLVYNASYAVSAQAYSVTVGAGGAGRTDTTAATQGGANGGNSVFGTVTALGGGGGGNTGDSGYGVGSNGGSGGGGGPYGAAVRAGGTGSQGNNGGSSGTTPSPYPGGGGGGAGGAGGNGSVSTGGAGGAGVAYSITGSSVTYAGGGGGGVYGGGTGGAGGAGGGGNGANSGAGAGGAANTGGGGGGASVGYTGGSGGSGIVVVRYRYQ